MVGCTGISAEVRILRKPEDPDRSNEKSLVGG